MAGKSDGAGGAGDAGHAGEFRAQRPRTPRATTTTTTWTPRRSFAGNIITTRTYQERLDTLEKSAMPGSKSVLAALRA